MEGSTRGEVSVIDSYVVGLCLLVGTKVPSQKNERVSKLYCSADG